MSTGSFLAGAGRMLALVRRRWYLIVPGVILAAGGLVLLRTASLAATTPRPTRVLAADGQVIGTLHGAGDHRPVPLAQISPFLRNAVVATEDRTFYRHPGVSFRGILRALITDLREGGVHEGGSTLTQQYVRTAFPAVGRQRTIARKVREMVLAFKVERGHTKDEILELHLNAAYFGRGAYGAEAASRAYLSKPAAELTLSEAAYLAGVIRSPEHLQPDSSMEAALAVRNEVLGDLLKAGYATAEEVEQARAQPLQFRLQQEEPGDPQRAAFFVEYVRRLLHSEHHLTDAEIYGGGLTVETTLDLRAQDAAERAVASTLDRPDDPEAALVAMDTSGRIRAMVGGRDFMSLERARGFNFAYQGSGSAGGRQAGSAFKPFVLAAFVDQGRSVRTTFRAPGTIDVRSPACRDESGSAWKVSNFGGAGFGRITVAQATTGSVNTVYAQMIDLVRPGVVADLTERIGGWKSIPPLCSIALGTPSVTPLEMARAYTTFAARGERPDPFAVTRILLPGGKVLAERKPHRVEVLDASVADTVNQVLQGGVTGAKGIGRPAAGKTGTTQNYVDAWFVGYTPTLTAAVWMGYPLDHATGRVPTMEHVRGGPVTGSSFPATIWQRFMREALKGTKAEPFVKPGMGGKATHERPKRPATKKEARPGEEPAASPPAPALAPEDGLIRPPDLPSPAPSAAPEPPAPREPPSPVPRPSSSVVTPSPPRPQPTRPAPSPGTSPSVSPSPRPSPSPSPSLHDPESAPGG